MVEMLDTRKKKPRSPSYPAIGLRDALERARMLYNEEGRNYAPVDTVLDHWGYRPKSGGGLVVLAALKKFGLIDDEGSADKRRVRVSQDALRILLDERDDPSERTRLLQAAALAPSIHAELWEKYQGSLPSDKNLHHELIFERGFTPGAATDFIRQFRETITFTGLSPSDSLSAINEDKPSRGDDDRMTTYAPTAPAKAVDGRSIQIPISLDEWATLHAPFPLSEDEWGQMIAVLEAMKPALVSPGGARPALLSSVNDIDSDDGDED